jgi:hypothetical protein
MNVGIGTVAEQFLFWKYLFQIFGIGSSQCIFRNSQSNELTRGPPELVHIVVIALLLYMILIWFGCIARLSQRGGEGYFTCSNNFYLPSQRLEGGGGSAPCGEDWQNGRPSPSRRPMSSEP